MTDSGRLGAIGIQNYGPSGTLLLQSLLDGHPQILTTPALYSRHLYTFWETWGHLDAQPLIETFMTSYRHWFSPDGAEKAWGLHQLGPQMKDAVWVPADAFGRAMRQRMQPASTGSRRAFLTAVYHAYASALGRQVRAPAYLVYPMHSLPVRHADYLVEDFPNAKFLYMVREPLQNMGSLMKHIMVNRLPVHPFESAVSQLLNDYMRHGGWREARFVKGDRPYRDDYADRSRAIRLEDLHADPSHTLREVCFWLGIEWHDGLLESTFDGKRWWNRPESPRVSGFGTHSTGRKYTELFSAFDRRRLHALAHPKATAWRYDEGVGDGSFMFRLATLALLAAPFKAEWKMMRWDLYRDRFRDGVDFALRLLRWMVRQVGVDLPDPSSLRLYRSWSASEAVSRPRPSVSMVLDALLIAVLPLMVARDYVMIRVRLIRSWIDGWLRKRPEVSLLMHPLHRPTGSSPSAAAAAPLRSTHPRNPGGAHPAQ